MVVRTETFRAEDSTIEVEIDTDSDRIRLDASGKGRVEVLVEDGVGRVDGRLPTWAENPLRKLGVRHFEEAR